MFIVATAALNDVQLQRKWQLPIWEEKKKERKKIGGCVGRASQRCFPLIGRLIRQRYQSASTLNPIDTFDNHRDGDGSAAAWISCWNLTNSTQHRRADIVTRAFFTHVSQQPIRVLDRWIRNWLTKLFMNTYKIYHEHLCLASQKYVNDQLLVISIISESSLKLNSCCV